jgi:hypothetical protein
MWRKVLILTVIYFMIIFGIVYIDLYKSEKHLESNIQFIYQGF